MQIAHNPFHSLWVRFGGRIETFGKGFIKTPFRVRDGLKSLTVYYYNNSDEMTTKNGEKVYEMPEFQLIHYGYDEIIGRHVLGNKNHVGAVHLTPKEFDELSQLGDLENLYLRQTIVVGSK